MDACPRAQTNKFESDKSESDEFEIHEASRIKHHVGRNAYSLKEKGSKNWKQISQQRFILTKFQSSRNSANRPIRRRQETTPYRLRSRACVHGEACFRTTASVVSMKTDSEVKRRQKKTPSATLGSRGA
jgi:hypothetical protein